jgi:hypothetical protein
MKAVYEVLTCCDNHVAFVEYDVPDDCDDCDDVLLRIKALQSAGYDAGAKCDGCGDNLYHAVFHCFGPPSLPGRK